MFGNFLTLLGVSGDSEPDKPQATQNTPEDQRRESDRRRDLILQLATYLSAVKVKSSTQKRIVESVRQVSEVVIWSDRRNPELLSYVVEVNLHRALLRLLQDRRGGNASVAVAVQVLQTLSIILDGITESRFLYSLFSNNFVNELIAAPVDLENDEILAYYVAFLKALSLKLTTDTIHFFFNERLDDFPLYTTAISLFDHPDSMVRVAVRAITLNVFRINDQDALEFILSAPACAHFWQMIMRALKDCYDDAFRILVDMPTVTPRLQTAPIATSVVDNRMSEIQEWAAVDQILENHMGLLSYMNDIYGLGVERINQRITSRIPRPHIDTDICARH
ncbi:hypothetical protein DL89DRAFT_14349 [Linderina pennispora]|uniref:FPL domain-containing protein n=1 Tax=Linderina pennispora TaxID=61395 RepID=A0A1Y1WLG7_9FUNG|nr:uncharacterized protein DL89DRAFT_14349 [Linderina pennispora]ORX74342.1 hypothetical protein DL89DRAFT_14349 [Linderina pennispora]